MSDTPKTDKIVELIEDLFHESSHRDYIESKDSFTKKEMIKLLDLTCEASFVISTIDQLEVSLRAVETAKLGEKVNG